MKSTLLTLFLSITATLSVVAQTKGLMDQVRDEEKDAIEAIALYPEKERSMILDAAQHPEVLVRLENMQAKSASDFRNLIGYLPEEDQKKVYNISRFPVLMYMITEGGKKKSSQRLNEVLADYPDEIASDVRYLHDQHFDLLAQVHQLYVESDTAFKDALNSYPADIQKTYKELIGLPEIMMIMSNNLNMTVLLGDLYRNNPEKIKNELDSLNVVVAEKKAKELNDWKEALEKDPQAMAEYENESQDFASQHNYTQSDYSQSLPDRYQTDVYVHHMWQPYPYWFGCPWWYGYDCWYPYPWWYHWGYYYGPGYTIVIIGMPSAYYLNWHFKHIRHFYNFPHFSNVLIHYSQTHSKDITTVTTATQRWIRDNHEQLPNEWLKDDGNRIDRIKEYGKFNMDYEASIANGTNNIPSQRDYLAKHAKEYPSLEPVLKEKPDALKKQEPVIQRNEPSNNEPANQDQRPYEPKPKVIQQPKTNQQEIERAKVHHENTWERPKPNINPRPVIKTPVSRPPVRNVPNQRPPTQRPPVKKK